MRTLSVLGALGQRRLGEMAIHGGLHHPAEPFGQGEASAYAEGGYWSRGRKSGMVTGIDWGSRQPDQVEYEEWCRRQDMATVSGRARRLIAKIRDSYSVKPRGSRMPGKTKMLAMLASSYTGMHNEGALWVDSHGSYPFYGPWLPRPEPEVFYQ
jgi:hypothetical protein